MEKGQSSVFIFQREPVLGSNRQVLAFKVVLRAVEQTGFASSFACLLLCFLDACGVQFKQISVRGYESSNFPCLYSPPGLS